MLIIGSKRKLLELKQKYGNSQLYEKSVLPKPAMAASASFVGFFFVLIVNFIIIFSFDFMYLTFNLFKNTNIPLA